MPSVVLYGSLSGMKTDGRAVDHATLTELRKRGVAAVQAGETPESVAAALGVHLRTVFRWLAEYRRGGWGGLEAHKRGGRPPKLDGKALRWIYRTVVDKNPMQLNFPFALWTAAMVQALVLDRYGVRLARLIHGMAGIRWRVSHNALKAFKDWVSKPSCPRQRSVPHPPCPTIRRCRSAFQPWAARS